MINITDMINITNNTNSTDNPDDNEDDDVIMNVYKIVAIVILATICVIPCSYYLIIKPLCITPYQNQNISICLCIDIMGCGNYIIFSADLSFSLRAHDKCS